MSGLSTPYAPLTVEEFLKGRDKLEPLTPELEKNLSSLLLAVCQLLKRSKLPFYGISSGYRPASINKSVGGAKASSHMSCQALDLRDPNGAIDAWCLANEKVLVELGLYLEHPDHTPGWCHLQTRPTKSGKHVFIP